jgi:translation initiation factor 1A
MRLVNPLLTPYPRNDNEKRELTFKEEGQEYAQVIKMLGNGRLEAQCFDGARRLAHIRGKLRKKVWINQGDVGAYLHHATRLTIYMTDIFTDHPPLRDYQDEKGDVRVSLGHTKIHVRPCS